MTIEGGLEWRFELVFELMRRWDDLINVSADGNEVEFDSEAARSCSFNCGVVAVETLQYGGIVAVAKMSRLKEYWFRFQQQGVGAAVAGKSAAAVAELMLFKVMDVAVVVKLELQEE
ncbi:hypothetical protein C5167_013395 [Papaver somniferum]|uniref:Uncharacterized protein n=1 Tax=Papaver somniferum TaxID=3469 RepID=A0A4Y7J395_PAPSO|nr:hypothetical protein C5167_013395 [Papaver somniferum]